MSNEQKIIEAGKALVLDLGVLSRESSKVSAEDFDDAVVATGVLDDLAELNAMCAEILAEMDGQNGST